MFLLEDLFTIFRIDPKTLKIYFKTFKYPFLISGIVAFVSFLTSVQKQKVFSDISRAFSKAVDTFSYDFLTTQNKGIFLTGPNDLFFLVISIQFLYSLRSKKELRVEFRFLKYVSLLNIFCKILFPLYTYLLSAELVSISFMIYSAIVFSIIDFAFIAAFSSYFIIYLVYFLDDPETKLFDEKNLEGFRRLFLFQLLLIIGLSLYKLFIFSQSSRSINDFSNPSFESLRKWIYNISNLFLLFRFVFLFSPLFIVLKNQIIIRSLSSSFLMILNRLPYFFFLICILMLFSFTEHFFTFDNYFLFTEITTIAILYFFLSYGLSLFLILYQISVLKKIIDLKNRRNFFD